MYLLDGPLIFLLVLKKINKKTLLKSSMNVKILTRNLSVTNRVSSKIP